MTASPLPVLPLHDGHIKLLVSGDSAVLTATQAGALAGALLTPGADVTYSNFAWHTTLTLTPAPQGVTLSTYKGQHADLTAPEAGALAAALRAALTGQPAPGSVQEQITAFTHHSGGVVSGRVLQMKYPDVTWTAHTPGGPRHVPQDLLTKLRVRTAQRPDHLDLLLVLPTTELPLTTRSA
ncbi:hypothetical protein [Deinococcus soli (ex Cha et al. 2016)]|uniref:Uncharacterized protein n=2 Tax=Deinococcus soli (ex Cha et al. 2016) TaxID=1309411 RepID=A0ACC6KKV2_9DEIO|nr:hypothetical protein [Deinococcus soli (ex Cha et al. 2016)]MDR6218623.1 hypothetical protein [Deinococcus soli (ex Cha et al. 2016)]MDR6328420.1 hypothetical protein [Deinococcus soli (ex Cha et al. 2016)]MDR6753031.1 hypothetical protein [Deinococcus soli (ex Cha et al. 2016)]